MMEVTGAERPRWRLLDTGYADGASNMAVDEAIQLLHAAGQVPPTIRFYRWRPACLSLGYFQNAEQVDQARLRERGLGLVRRPTGGRAILHDQELTYSVVAAESEPRVSGGVVESYRRISAGLSAGLSKLGMPVTATPAHRSGRRPHSQNAACFDVPSDYELTVEGRKLVGSAQTRRHGVILQHGSLMLELDCAALYELFLVRSEQTRQRLISDLESRVAALNPVLGRAPSHEELVAVLSAGFEEALAIELAPGELSAQERQLAEELRLRKYVNDEWTLHRRRPAGEEDGVFG